MMNGAPTAIAMKTLEAICDIRAKVGGTVFVAPPGDVEAFKELALLGLWCQEWFDALDAAELAKGHPEADRAIMAAADRVNATRKKLLDELEARKAAKA